MTPDVTLYVPCYNARAYLSWVIPALCRQDVATHELLLVDDASTDGSAELAEELAAAHGRPLRTIRHPHNRGLAAARNTAIAACRSRYLAGVDADVCPAPDWLRLLLAGCDGDSRLAGVGGRLSERHTATPGDRWRARHLAMDCGLRPGDAPPYLFGSNHVFRHAALVAVGGYDERNRRAGDDVSMGAKLRHAGWRLRYVPEAHCEHLRRDTVLSSLATYWRWKYYGNWSDDRSLRRVARAACGDCTAAWGRLLAADLRRWNSQCLAMDLLYPAVSIVQHVRAYRAARR